MVNNSWSITCCQLLIVNNFQWSSRFTCVEIIFVLLCRKILFTYQTRSIRRIKMLFATRNIILIMFLLEVITGWSPAGRVEYSDQKKVLWDISRAIPRLLWIILSFDTQGQKCANRNSTGPPFLKFICNFRVLRISIRRMMGIHCSLIVKIKP